MKEPQKYVHASRCSTVPTTIQYRTYPLLYGTSLAMSLPYFPCFLSFQIIFLRCLFASQYYLGELIRAHQRLGTLHSHEWHTQPLPPTLTTDSWQNLQTIQRLAASVSLARGSTPATQQAMEDASDSVSVQAAATSAMVEAETFRCEFAYAGACPCGSACECECDCPCADSTQEQSADDADAAARAFE